VTLHPETLGCFFSNHLHLTPFDPGVHPEGLGIEMDKKLQNDSC